MAKGSGLHPVYLTPSGWNALLPPRVVRDALPAARAFRSIVIGAGFTGLAAARRLAEHEPGHEHLLIDADVIGENASGRNSGFLSIHPNEPVANRHGSVDDAAARQMRLYRAGRDHLKMLVDRHGIDCGWDETAPRLLGAATEGGVSRARAALERYRRSGLGAEEIDAAGLKERTGSDYYRYAVRADGHVLVQPAALVRGVADVLPDAVRLVERLPVSAIEGGGPFKVRTGRGDFRADRLLVTANLHARALGLLGDRMIGVYTYGGLTPELDDAALAAHGSLPQWGLIPAHPMGTTIRKFSGRRFLVRSGDAYEREDDPVEVRGLLTELYRNRYPGLSSHDLEHVWGGVTAITRNGGLYFGSPRHGLFCAAGCNGSGVVRGTINGLMLADLAVGATSSLLDDRLKLEGPNWIPPDPLRSLVVRSKIALGRREAGAEI
ncbi:MAG: FAD-dependent oxidoreductase [Hyphomicrobiaceae bacterium]